MMLKESQKNQNNDNSDIHEQIPANHLTDPPNDEKYLTYDCSNFDAMKEITSTSMDLLKGIYAYGFDIPSVIQAKSIPPMAHKRDLIAQSQSGTGKTGAFAIGMLTRINPSEHYLQGIIVAHTKELARQIHHVISEISKFMNIKIHLCIGGIDIKTNYNDALSAHIWIGTPGRIIHLIDKDVERTKHRRGKQCIFVLDRLNMLVLDEVDKLLEQPFLDQIKVLLKYIPQKTQICIFSATYKEAALETTSHFMRNPVKILLEPEKVNLELIKHFKVNVMEERYKYDTLAEMYHHINICQTVIFTNSINKADYLADRLSADGHSVGTIHSKLSDIERCNVLTEFRNMNTRVLVATDLISRCIDVQQVGLVINYDVPSDAENYIHRIGRSGRYGKTGVAINLTTKSRFDRDTLKYIEDIYKLKIDDLPSLEHVNYYLTGANGYNLNDVNKT